MADELIELIRLTPYRIWKSLQLLHNNCVHYPFNVVYFNHKPCVYFKAEEEDAECIDRRRDSEDYSTD